jgi:hypothetical protein
MRDLLALRDGEMRTSLVIPEWGWSTTPNSFFESFASWEDQIATRRGPIEPMEQDDPTPTESSQDAEKDTASPSTSRNHAPPENDSSIPFLDPIERKMNHFQEESGEQQENWLALAAWVMRNDKKLPDQWRGFKGHEADRCLRVDGKWTEWSIRPDDLGFVTRKDNKPLPQSDWTVKPCLLTKLRDLGAPEF